MVFKKGYKQTEEQQRKLIKARTGKKFPKKEYPNFGWRGKEGPNKGKKSWNAGLTKETDIRVAKSAVKMKRPRSEKSKANMKGHSGVYERTPENCKAIGEGRKGKKYPEVKYPNHGMRKKKHSKKTREKQSKSRLEFFKDPREIEKLSKAKLKNWQDSEYQKMMAEARALKPNKLEQFFDELTPEYIQYVGDFKFSILTKIRTRFPDFKIQNQKKVIELFGDYYHKGEDPVNMIKEYTEAGWECIVFWESEVYEETRRILKETLEFVNQKIGFKKGITEMEEKDIIKERPSKYVLRYGKSLKQIAAIFGVSITTIWTWLNDPDKKRWLEQKLKEKR